MLMPMNTRLDIMIMIGLLSDLQNLTYQVIVNSFVLVYTISPSSLKSEVNNSPNIRYLDLKLLPPQPYRKSGKKTLLIDLDETLVHSAFMPFRQKSDITLNVELDVKRHIIHVLKRPFVDEFLNRMSKMYELVIFTASLAAVSK